MLTQPPGDHRGAPALRAAGHRRRRRRRRVAPEGAARSRHAG